MKKGIMISEISFANFPLILKNSGLDFFIIDCEHGGFDYKDVSAIITNAKLVNIKCIIRLANNHRKDIIKYLDMGAGGLLLPMTNSLEEIKEVVKFAKYYPLGIRGISTMRAHTLYDPPNILEYMEKANRDNVIYAQIETKKGIDNIEKILSVEGVNGCFIGPNDLACDLECLGGDCDNVICEKIAYIAQKSKEYNKICGIITGKQKYLEKASEVGVSAFCVGSELNLIANGAKLTSKRLDDLSNK